MSIEVVPNPPLEIFKVICQSNDPVLLYDIYLVTALRSRYTRIHYQR
jgi:hypothetical protein